MEHDEWLDLVDGNDRVIERMLRSEVYRRGLHNYRAVNLFIMNSKGELWVQKRTQHKKLFPSGLDFSCAGHVESGESYEDTLRREVAEELNLDTDACEVRFLGPMTPAEGFPCFCKNYEIRSDNVPTYNRDDFVGYEWLTPRELVNRIEGGVYAKDGLPKAVKKFYLR